MRLFFCSRDDDFPRAATRRMRPCLAASRAPNDVPRLLPVPVLRRVGQGGGGFVHFALQRKATAQARECGVRRCGVDCACNARGVVRAITCFAEIPGTWCRF